MAYKYAVRGNDLDAYYAAGNKYSTKLAANTAYIPVVAASGLTNAIGGYVIDMDQSVALQVRYLQYCGRNNVPLTGFSILLRCSFGTSSGLIGLCGWGAGDQGTFNRVTIYYNAGTLNARSYNENANLRMNLSVAWTPTTNTFYDIVLTWDGTTNANAAKLYVNGTLQVQGTVGQALPADNGLNVRFISLGSSAYDVQSTKIVVNEFVIWDTVIDPTSVSLESGTGSLNGSSRSSFVATPNFNGGLYSDPGASNVKNGVGYTYAGVSTTGSLVSVNPGASNVKNGIGYTIESLSYTGSLISVNPGITNVKNGVGYTIENASYTGSLVSVDPGIANVKFGTGYTIENMSYTGALPQSTDPGVSNVRLATQYLINGSTLTGTLSVPTAASGTAGTVDLNNLLEQIRYVLNANNTTTSSLDISANLTTRVQFVAKTHPERIPIQPSLYPFVTCYINDKTIEEKTISKNQLNAKRKSVVGVDIVGAVWNMNMQTITSDPADIDCHYLMEQVEYCLRAYDNLGGAVTWQFSDGVKYYSSIQEGTHLRAGVLSLKATLYY